MAGPELRSVRDLSIEEFKVLVERTVRETIEDEIEDRAASKSPAYLASIADAREDYDLLEGYLRPGTFLDEGNLHPNRSSSIVGIEKSAHFPHPPPSATK